MVRAEGQQRWGEVGVGALGPHEPGGGSQELPWAGGGQDQVGWA